MVNVLPTSAEQFMAHATAEQLIAFQSLTPAVATLNQLAAIATQFAPHGTFPCIANPNAKDPGLEFGWCHAAAIMRCADDLHTSSYAFQRPSPDVKSSPWLHGITPPQHDRRGRRTDPLLGRNRLGRTGSGATRLRIPGRQQRARQGRPA